MNNTGLESAWWRKSDSDGGSESGNNIDGMTPDGVEDGGRPETTKYDEEERPTPTPYLHDISQTIIPLEFSASLSLSLSVSLSLSLLQPYSISLPFLLWAFVAV